MSKEYEHRKWNSTQLGEVITLQRGYDLPYRDRASGDFPVVTSTGITDTHSEYREQAPGVVTGRYGTIGEVFYIDKDYWPHNTTLFVKDFHGNNPLFTAYLLTTIDFQSHSGKSGVPGVNRNDLHALEVSVPSVVEEQEAIASTLSDIDNLLASLDRLIAKKRDLKQATMQQLLTGQKRLPGFSKSSGYKTTELGLIPEDWVATQLGQVGQVIMGQSPSGNSYNQDGQGMPLINGPTEFTDKHPVKIQWTTEPTRLCKVDDLLVCVRGSSTGRMNISTDEFCIGRGVAAIRANEHSVTSYLTYQIDLAIRKLLELSTGSTFPSVDGKAIKAIPIPYPEKEEQKAIAQVLTDMDTELTTLQTRRAKTQALKQAMMQELLTGKTRLLPPTAKND